MWKACVGTCVMAVCAVLLWGCSTRPDFVAREEPWRAADEQSCIASGRVRETPFVHSRSALGGPSVCGAAHPFEMAATSDGRVAMRPTALLRCQMVPAVDAWIATVVEPAARRHFGVGVAEIKVAASYGCRPMNNQSGGQLSEHGYANALDVSQFVLESGQIVSVKEGWHGDDRQRGFLRAVHDGACQGFTTVLGPEANAYHRDHFHMDLARHGRDGQGRICK